MEENNQNKDIIERSENKENYINDFVQEILETLDSIELELVNLEVDPDNPEYLNAVHFNFHTIKGLTGYLEDNLAARLAEDTKALLEACRKFNISTSRNMINLLLQTILFFRRICNNEKLAEDSKFQGEIEQHLLGIRQLRDEIMLDVKQPVRSTDNRIGEILVEEGVIEKQDVDEVLEKQSNIYRKMKFGEIAVRERKVDAGELIKAIRVQKIRNEGNDQYVQLPIKRLDQILDIVNQLGSIQNDLHHESVLRFGSNDVFSVETKRAEDLSSDIRNILCELRLVTLKHSFRKLTRAVRAMIEEEGLHVVFSTMGENTELNKETAEEMIVPLAEIIECMLSGFSPDSGKDNGKMGSIEVAAWKEDDTVNIDISSNQSASGDKLHESRTLERIRMKVEKMKGRLEVENLDEGCRVRLILNR